MMKKYLELLTEHKFNADFFLEKKHSETLEHIRKAYEKFEKKHPSFLNIALKNLKKKFPDAVIENHTQFFNDDRCYRLLVQVSEENRFVLQISIFEFLSIYRHPISCIGNEFKYDGIIFIDRHDSKFADNIAECVENYNFDWLSKTDLETVVDHLSVKNDDSRFANLVILADVLFTNHYL